MIINWKFNENLSGEVCNPQFKNVGKLDLAYPSKSSGPLGHIRTPQKVKCVGRQFDSPTLHGNFQFVGMLLKVPIYNAQSIKRSSILELTPSPLSLTQRGASAPLMLLCVSDTQQYGPWKRP